MTNNKIFYQIPLQIQVKWGHRGQVVQLCLSYLSIKARKISHSFRLMTTFSMAPEDMLQLWVADYMPKMSRCVSVHRHRIEDIISPFYFMENNFVVYYIYIFVWNANATNVMHDLKLILFNIIYCVTFVSLNK